MLVNPFMPQGPVGGDMPQSNMMPFSNEMLQALAQAQMMGQMQPAVEAPVASPMNALQLAHQQFLTSGAPNPAHWSSGMQIASTPESRAITEQMLGGRTKVPPVMRPGPQTVKPIPAPVMRAGPEKVQPQFSQQPQRQMLPAGGGFMHALKNKANNARVMRQPGSSNNPFAY